VFIILGAPSLHGQSPDKRWTVAVEVSDSFGQSAQGTFPADDYETDLYERLDYSDPLGARADIRSFRTGNDNNYYYFEFVFATPWNFESAQNAVAVEIDWDSSDEDSRGDYLVMMRMDDEFSQQGNWRDGNKNGDYKFYEDRNNDVGGPDPRAPDFPGNYDGYETNLGKANQTVWGRVTGQGTFQIAVRRDEIPDTTLLLARGWAFQDWEPSTREFTSHDHYGPGEATNQDNMASSDTGTWPPIDPPDVEEADVGIELSVDDPIPQVDQEFVYTLTASHVSGETARATSFEFFVPAELTYVGHVASAGSYDLNAGVWTVGDIAAGQSFMLEVTVTAAIEQLGELILAETQLLAGDFIDTDPDNNTDEIEVRIAGRDGSVAWVTDLTGTTVQEFASPGSNVHVRVVDEDLNLDPAEAETVLVRLRSQSANDEEIITLTEISTDSGTFTGVIATSTDQVDVADGELQVQPGDTGEATYSDAIDSKGNVGVIREAFIEFVQPQLVLNLTVDKFEAEPGEEITYIVSYVNQGQLAGANVLVQQNIPRFTTYVANSMRIGLATDTYETAFALTDIDDGVEGTVNGAQVGGVLSDRVEVTISSVAADDGNQGGGPNQGRVFFKVTIDE